MTKNKNSETSGKIRLKLFVIIFFAFISISAGLLYYKAEYIILGAEGYIFGYPLVITDVSRVSAALTLGPENQLYRLRGFPDAKFKGVVRPNVDTLYTTAFIDMAQGPWVFEISKNDKRYELMSFMDAWTNVFAAPGTRSTGLEDCLFLLVGPGWTGAVPSGIKLLRSPTRIVWLIGRTQTNGISDYPTVHRLQDRIKLSKLSSWQSGQDKQHDSWHSSEVEILPPVVQMKKMNTFDFFSRLAKLMADNPPSAADGPMMVKLSRIGIFPGHQPEWSILDRCSVSLGRLIADWTVAKELKKPRNIDRGWVTPPVMIGNYGTFYNLRAVVAMVGLGANLPEDAIYPNTRIDAKGETLNGRNRYRLHFNYGELPPVNAFWSVTAYGEDNFFIENPINRYALSNLDPLVFNSDGSLDLYIQSDPPVRIKNNNWLPVKYGELFLLNARLYWPKPAALNGSWGMPAVERLE